MRIALCVIAVALATGCGSNEPGAEPVVHRAPAGIAIELAPGWQAAASSLTPNLSDPRERLSVGTFPLEWRKSGCEHLPSGALHAISAEDAFVTLFEQGRPTPANGYPESRFSSVGPRPEPLRPDFSEQSELTACMGPGKRPVRESFMNFTDAGRAFYLHVVVGDEASEETRAELNRMLDSLRIDPNQPPDWEASP